MGGQRGSRYTQGGGQGSENGGRSDWWGKSERKGIWKGRGMMREGKQM